MIEIKIFTELQKGEQIEIGLNLVSKSRRQKYFTFFVPLVQLYGDFLTKIRPHMPTSFPGFWEGKSPGNEVAHMPQEDYACMHVLPKVDR